MLTQKTPSPQITVIYPACLTEQNNTHPSDRLIIFNNLGDSWRDDGDCACSASSGDLELTSLPPENDFLFQIPSQLISVPLNNSYWVIFNPHGTVGPVVINQFTRNILDSFVTPISLQRGSINSFGKLSNQSLITANHLAALGLLVTPEKNIINKYSIRTLTAWLHVTNECNLRCDYCYIEKTFDRMEVERGKNSVDAVFRSALASEFKAVKLKYAGGEATLNFSLILELHDYAQEVAQRYGLKLTGVVLSNGVGVSTKMIEALQKRNLKLSISLDGIKEFQDLQRKFINGKGSFSLVEKTLKRLSAYSIKPSITITVSSRNLDGLPNVVDYVLKRNLPFTINFYRENECSASYTDLAYNDEELIATMRKTFLIIEKNLPPFSILGSLVDRAQLGTSHDKPCGVGESYMVIDHFGKVAKCHMEIEKSITDVTAENPLKLIQLDQTGIQNISVKEKEGCRDCTWQSWCAGGCPALTYRFTGRYDVKSPNCRIYKALFPDVLRLEGLRLLKYSDILPL